MKERDTEVVSDFEGESESVCDQDVSSVGVFDCVRLSVSLLDGDVDDEGDVEGHSENETEVDCC